MTNTNSPTHPPPTLIRVPSTDDRISMTTSPPASYKTFLYALLGFTVLTIAVGGAYQLYHQRQEQQDRKKKGNL
jgi:hypothetical protein